VRATAILTQQFQILGATENLQEFSIPAPLLHFICLRRIRPTLVLVNQKKGITVKLLLWKSIFVATIASLSIAGQAQAQSPDNDRCTDRTLQGDYAFTVTGTIWVTDPMGVLEEVQRGGVAMTHFDGIGGLSQVDYVVSGLNSLPTPPPAPSDPVTGFHVMEMGKYTVNSDCTGQFTINSPGTTIVTKFVLSNRGHAIHAIVISLTLPTGPVVALIHSEGQKLDDVDANRY
jgi:hypothetical protein